MFSGRPAKFLMVFSLAAGAALLATAVLSVWQHDVVMGGMMRRMMGGVFPGMMLWMVTPLIIAAAVLMILPVAFYILLGSQTTSITGLTEEEKAVVDYLTRNGGSSEQRAIAKTLGFSRLKTHRLIASLRRRNVVEVEPRGRTNIVKLKNFQKTSAENLV
ncbi:MAG: hypothetical protein QXH12_06370 [Candidatus Caldarchaeum sp.]